MTVDERLREVHRLRVNARARLQDLHHSIGTRARYDGRPADDALFWDRLDGEAKEAALDVAEIRRHLRALRYGEET